MDLYWFFHGWSTFQPAILEKWPTFRLAIAKESSLSSKFIKLIDKLLNLEEEYHNQCHTVDEIKQRRLKESKAILDEYFTLASSSLDSSDGALRKPINYSLKQKEKLSRFL